MAQSMFFAQLFLLEGILNADCNQSVFLLLFSSHLFDLCIAQIFDPSCFPCEFLTPSWHLHTLFSGKLSGSFFGSFYSWVSIEEIYKDAHMYGLKSSNSQAVTNSSLAIAWLEATFPELVNQAKEGGSLLALKARPYVPFDASLALQVFFPS